MVIPALPCYITAISMFTLLYHWPTQLEFSGSLGQLRACTAHEITDWAPRWVVHACRPTCSQGVPELGNLLGLQISPPIKPSWLPVSVRLQDSRPCAALLTRIWDLNALWCGLLENLGSETSGHVGIYVNTVQMVLPYLLLNSSTAHLRWVSCSSCYVHTSVSVLQNTQCPCSHRALVNTSPPSP